MREAAAWLWQPAAYHRLVATTIRAGAGGIRAGAGASGQVLGLLAASGHGDQYLKGGAVSWRASNAHRAVMSFGDRLHDRQAQAKPAVVAVYRAGEPPEDPAAFPGRNPGTRIGHREHRGVAADSDADLDLVGFGGVLDGVLQQRVERDDEAVLVGEHGHLGYLAEPPPARHSAPALNRVEYDRIRRHRSYGKEVRAACRGEQQ